MFVRVCARPWGLTIVLCCITSPHTPRRAAFHRCSARRSHALAHSLRIARLPVFIILSHVHLVCDLEEGRLKGREDGLASPPVYPNPPLPTPLHPAGGSVQQRRFINLSPSREEFRPFTSRRVTKAPHADNPLIRRFFTCLLMPRTPVLGCVPFGFCSLRRY